MKLSDSLIENWIFCCFDFMLVSTFQHLWDFFFHLSLVEVDVMNGNWGK